MAMATEGLSISHNYIITCHSGSLPPKRPDRGPSQLRVSPSWLGSLPGFPGPVRPGSRQSGAFTCSEYRPGPATGHSPLVQIAATLLTRPLFHSRLQRYNFSDQPPTTTQLDQVSTGISANFPCKQSLSSFNPVQ